MRKSLLLWTALSGLALVHSAHSAPPFAGPCYQGTSCNLEVVTAGSAQINGALILAVREITALVTADTATASDYLIAWDTADAAAKTETIPACASAIKGQTYIIKDEYGNAAAWNITITPAVGTIDGVANIVLAVNFGAFVLTCNGNTNWMVN